MIGDRVKGLAVKQLCLTGRVGDRRLFRFHLLDVVCFVINFHQVDESDITGLLQGYLTPSGSLSSRDVYGVNRRVLV